MKKIPKAYRLNPGTVDQIQAIKKFFADQGYVYSDANIVEMALSNYMDNVAQIKNLKEKGYIK